MRFANQETAFDALKMLQQFELIRGAKLKCAAVVQRDQKYKV